MSEVDTKVLELSLKKLSEAFDEFISKTADENGKPKAPSKSDISKARGYLPKYCNLAYKKK